MRWIKATAAALALLALLIIPPWALVSFIGNPWPAEGASLSAALTDGAIIGLLAVAVWVLWAQLVVCVVVEAIAAFSADRIRPRAPFTLGVQQQLARRLVTAIVVATVSTPVAIGGAATAATGDDPASVGEGTRTSLTTDRHDGVQQHPNQPGRAGTLVDRDQDRDRQPAGTAVDRDDPAHDTVTVMRLDTLMDIADRVLGDADRWEEIAALNEGRVMNDGTVFHSADYIRPGWELQIPADAADQERGLGAGGRHVVETGDTLSKIAQEELGDADRYPEIFQASRTLTQPGGKHLVDPDHIEPGWVLRIPDQHREGSPAGVNGGADAGQGKIHDKAGAPHLTDQPIAPSTGNGTHPRQQAQSQPPVTPLPPLPPQQEGSAERSTGWTDRTPVAAEQQADEDEVTVLRALLASAMCLSVGALGLVATNRRRQFRSRRIGRTIAATPQELAEVEQTIVENGSEAQENVEFLDRALRHVAASCKVAGNPLPQLGAAVLGEEDLTLLFTHPATGEVPEGWTATEDARAWMLPRWTLLEQDLETQPAPYPALVTIGQDEGGRTWLLDLETLGMCGIGGEPQQVADLARFMVAELAVNAWSEGSEVLLADQFGAETIGFNPARLRQVQRSDALARAAVLTGEMGEVEQNLDADVLTRRRDGLLLDTTNPVVVVVSSRPEGEFVADLEERERSRVVVVHGDEESPAVELAGDGRAFLPMWGISVKAFTLPTSEAEAMAALLSSTRNLEDEPVPAAQSADGPLGKYARADGALREEYTEPRRTEGNDPSSQLPDSDEVYLATAATTAEDLAAAAPSVPEETRAEIEALDPTLDQDVADWFAEASPRPKVHLLGPVEVTALNGGDPTAIDNLGGTISFIAYLACQDRGVTGERAAAACGWKTQKTVQNRATNARFLLGTQPDGSDWLPDASMSDGARRGTTPTYELVRGTGGVLNSADLFVRLKFRAQKRGDNGCEQDLVTALSLVTGAPFEAATEHRFKWLFKQGQQRHDEILVGAIHDAAHVLATRAVAEGRTDMVRLACDAARKASPHSDIAWLDLAAATEAESGRDAAGELVREQVLDRFDEDLPPRSEAVVDQREWATG
jgi:nucleoid-associated protein YgaU